MKKNHLLYPNGQSLSLYFQTKWKQRHKLKIYSKPKTKDKIIGLPPIKRFLYSHIARLGILSF
jgi:hypothetical protein